MTEPVVLSGTSLQTFFRCGHQWYLANVMGLRMPPNIRQVIGIATHSAVEHNFAQKLVSGVDVPLAEITDVFADNYDRMAADVPDPEEPLGSAKDSGIGLVKIHHRDVAPTIQPIWVEEAGQLTINAIPYSWTVDLVDQSRKIRDTKTRKARPKPEDAFLQMTGYALGYRQRTGQIEAGLVTDNLIRTQKPYYLPLEEGAANDQRIGSFVGALTAAHDAITKGSFVPNGLTNGACGWCGFATVCKYRNR